MTTQKKIFGGRATLKIPFLRPFNFFAEHNVEVRISIWYLILVFNSSDYGHYTALKCNGQMSTTDSTNLKPWAAATEEKILLTYGGKPYEIRVNLALK